MWWVGAPLLRHRKEDMKQSHHTSRHEAKSQPVAAGALAPAGLTGHDGGMEVQVREAAYYRYLARGAEVGHEVEDWLQAESQLLETGKSEDTSH
jgi:hypothetical protein